MKRKILRAVSFAAVFALLAALPVTGQAPNFSKYVALGDSYGAGFGAGCLVAREQRFSYPAILARQFGKTDFQQPTVSDPGLPVCIGVTSLTPLSFGPIAASPGAPTNLALGRPYDNLSVPGFKIADVSDTTAGGAADFVLRGQGSALNQALSLNPTFITLGIVGNDILTAAGAGFLLDGVTATPLPIYTQKYNTVAAALRAPGRTGVFLGTPDPRFIPLATTIPRFVTHPVTRQPLRDAGGNLIPLLGPRTTSSCTTAPCPLPAGTLVTLGASAPQAALGGQSLLQLGFGVPCNAPAPLTNLPRCGQPLPDGGFTPPATVNVGVLFYPDEVQALDDRVRAMNSVIQAAAAANGFSYFDFHAVSQDLIAHGREYGGIPIALNFVTGGFFAFGDAVHPSNIGYTILADALIQFINRTYRTDIERPDVAEALLTPDVRGGAAALAGSVEGEVLFPEESWRGFFEVFPPADSSLQVVLPVDSGPAPVEDRAPVIRRGRSGRS